MVKTDDCTAGALEVLRLLFEALFKTLNGGKIRLDVIFETGDELKTGLDRGTMSGVFVHKPLQLLLTMSRVCARKFSLEGESAAFEIAFTDEPYPFRQFEQAHHEADQIEAQKDSTEDWTLWLSIDPCNVEHGEDGAEDTEHKGVHEVRSQEPDQELHLPLLRER